MLMVVRLALLVGRRTRPCLAVLDGIPEEVLEDVPKPVAVGPNGKGGFEFERRPLRRHRLPALADHVRDGNRLGLTDGLALAGEGKRILDDRFHPVEGVHDRLDVRVIVRTLLFEQCDPSLGDVQWIPQVVGDDARKLL